MISKQSHLENLGFWIKEMIQSPSQTASISPSSKYLANLMTSAMPKASSTMKIVELGPGLGGITESIISRGFSPDNLILIESNKKLANRLKSSMPRLPIMITDAIHIQKVLKDFDCPLRVSCIVSSLGLLNIENTKLRFMLVEMDKSLTINGSFIQFTYGHKAPIPEQIRKDLNWAVEKVGATYLNLPPATVYKYTKLSK